MKKIIMGSLIGVLLLMIGVVGSYEHGNDVSDNDVFYMISHSEYWTGEEGQIIARLLDWQGDPITVTNCTIDILYPDKTYFVQNALTDDSLEATSGTHYYNFTVPATEGVYQYIATCNYPPNKQRSVANTFHVSPALNLIANVSQDIIDLTAQELSHYNDLQANITVINGDLLSIQTDIDEIQLNITDISDDTTYIRDNMLTETLFTANISTVITNQDTMITQGDNILSNLTAIEAFCDTAVTSGSSLCLWVDEIRGKVNDINLTVYNYNTILSEINQTTHSTYDYMTGTLATNINNIFTAVGRVETNTEQINATVNQIQQNQEDEVYMEVSS